MKVHLEKQDINSSSTNILKMNKKSISNNDEKIKLEFKRASQMSYHLNPSKNDSVIK